MKTESKINSHPTQSEPALSRRHALGSMLRKALFAGVLGVQILNTSSARAEEEMSLKSAHKMFQTRLFEPTPPFQAQGGTKIELTVRLYYQKNPKGAWLPYTGTKQPILFWFPAGPMHSVPMTAYTDPKTGYATIRFSAPKVDKLLNTYWNAAFNGDGRTLYNAPWTAGNLCLTP